MSLAFQYCMLAVPFHPGGSSMCHSFRGRIVDRLSGTSFYISYWLFVVFESLLADFRSWALGGGCAILEARFNGLNLSLFAITFEAPSHHPRVYSQLTYQQLPCLDIPRLRDICTDILQRICLCLGGNSGEAEV
eukprot:scaffold4059_cov393-Prasinococcus_capsulatus_cf.AAC.1